MALTGHEVVCWDEEGRPAFARLKEMDVEIGVYKEHISAKIGKLEMTIDEGFIMTRYRNKPIYIVAERVKHTFYFFFSIGDKLRFGLAKHAEFYPIERADLEYLPIFIAKTSWWVPSKLRIAFLKVKEAMKYDQGDAHLAPFLGAKELEEIAMPVWMEKYSKILAGETPEDKVNELRMVQKVLNKYAKKWRKLPKILKKLKSHRLSQEDAEFLYDVVEKLIWRAILW